MSRTQLLSCCAISFGLGVAGPTLAQTAQTPNTVNELVVTAERRGAENLLAVPMAVDAYSGQTLERFNVQSLQDLSKIDPSLTIQRYGVDQEQTIIRGISSTTGTTTGVYLDEAPLEGGFNANVYGDNTPVLAMHDVDHVEVLKGPQGTLFGAGSMDGTLRVITNKPDLSKYEGMAEGSAAVIDGGNGLFSENGMVNLPIIDDKLAVRIVGWGDEGGGYINQTIDGTTRDHVNDEHLYGGRVEALWKPTDRFSILGSVNYQNTRVDGSQAWTLNVGPQFAPGGPELGPFPPYQNDSPSQEPYSSRYILFTVTAQYDLGFGSIIATSTAGDKNQLEIVDGTPSGCSFGICIPGPGAPGAFSALSDFKDSTDEIRFSSDFKGPVQLVAGAYFEQDGLHYSGMQFNAIAATGAAPCDTYIECHALGLAQPGFGNSPVEFANADRFAVEQYALYGQVDWKILPNLTATVGARYFSASIHDEQINEQNIAPTQTPSGFDGGYVLGDITTPYVSSTGHTTESKPTFNFSLLWQVDPDVSLYARAASGFRIGGINEAAVIASQEGIKIPSSFGPDSLWDYEAGAKIYLLDRKVFLDLAVYRIDWSGEQEDALAAGVFNYTLNVGQSTVNGVELSSTFHPTSGLTFTGDVTYVDAYLSTNLPASVVTAGTPGDTGDRAPFVPRLSVAGVAEYEHSLSAQMVGYVQGDFTYHSNSFSAFRAVTADQIAAGAPNNFDTELPAYFLLDLKAGVRFNRFDLSVYAQNVTNSAAYLGVRAGLDAVRVYSPPPRTVGVDLVAHF